MTFYLISKQKVFGLPFKSLHVSHNLCTINTSKSVSMQRIMAVLYSYFENCSMELKIKI